MKCLALTLIAILTYGTSWAQGTVYHLSPSEAIPPDQTEVKKEQRAEVGSLKGPRAKNYPTHRYQASKAVVATPATSEKRMGPAAKNYRPGQDNHQAQHVVVTQKKRKNLKGPRAKNRKPWDN